MSQLQPRRTWIVVAAVALFGLVFLRRSRLRAAGRSPLLTEADRSTALVAPKTVPQPNRIRALLRGLRYVLAGLLAIAFFVGVPAVGLWWYLHASKIPFPPVPTGGLYLLSDEPHLHATIDVLIEQAESSHPYIDQHHPQQARRSVRPNSPGDSIFTDFKQVTSTPPLFSAPRPAHLIPLGKDSQFLDPFDGGPTTPRWSSGGTTPGTTSTTS
jgi:hypothetical protein